MRPGTVLRGNIVIIDFAPMNPNAGIRPALVDQNDHDNGRMGNTIVAQITSDVSRAHENTQLLIDSSHHNWSMSVCGVRPSSIAATSFS